MAEYDWDELQSRIGEGFEELEPGDEGFWPFIGFWADDIQPGDRVRFDDGFTVVVKEMFETKAPGLRVGVVPVEGERFTVGRMARGFQIDRWGTCTQLSRKSVR